MSVTAATRMWKSQSPITSRCSLNGPITSIKADRNRKPIGRKRFQPNRRWTSMKTSSLFKSSSITSMPLSVIRSHRFRICVTTAPYRVLAGSSRNAVVRSRNWGSQVSSSSCTATYCESSSLSPALEARSMPPPASRCTTSMRLRTSSSTSSSTRSTTAASPAWLTITSCQSSSVWSMMLATARGRSSGRSRVRRTMPTLVAYEEDGSDHSMP